MARRRDSYFPNVYGSGSDSAGFGPGSGLLSPEDNPAYQAAIAKGRPARSGFTTISTPSGGSMSVPAGQQNKYTDLLYKNNPVADTGFQRPAQQSAFALGNTGAVPQGNSPWEQSYRMGAQGEGAVQQPPSAGFGFQAGRALAGIPNILSGFASNVASMFKKGAAGFGAGPTNAGMYQPQQSQQSQNFYAYNPSPAPQQPRRYFDF